VTQNEEKRESGYKRGKEEKKKANPDNKFNGVLYFT